jgi:hypothetical protein
MKLILATKAEHKLGDISRDQPYLAWATSEDDENYIGFWDYRVVGFLDVKFPKSTSREITPEEADVIARHFVNDHSN